MRADGAQPTAGLRMGRNWQETEYGRGLLLISENTEHLDPVFGGSKPDDPLVELVPAAYGFVIAIIWHIEAG